MKNAQKSGKAKKIIIAVIAAMIVIAVAYFAVTALLQSRITDINSKDYGFSYYEPDYDCDIYSDSEFTVLELRILYSDGVCESYLGETFAPPENGVIAMLSEYIDSIRSGNAEKFRSFYSAALKKNFALPESFTMQRLYDAKITFLSSSEKTVDEETVTTYIYKIEYKIMKNDGTFRRDIDSDSVRPQTLTIEEKGDTYSIIHIIY